MEVQVIFKKSLQTVCLVLTVLFVFPGIAAAGNTVDSISVQIIPSDAALTPPARIAKRMSASVSTIGENVLLGHQVTEVMDKKSSYEKLVREVFDRILVGYSVKDVTISPGNVANIRVEVIPWGEVVNDVLLEVDYGTSSPELIKLIKQDMGNVEEQINGVLIGLPIDAVEWAGGVSKSVIRELLASQLPEFRSNLEVIPGAQTVVKLSLLPQGATIQDVRISLRSQTIPNVLLLQARPKVTAVANSLTGLPAAFVDRHRDHFSSQLQATVAEQSIVKRYGLSVTPAIHAGTNTEVTMDVETNKYNISLEGYLDFGREHDSTSAKLHLGKYTSPKDEAFMELEFVPSTVSWRFMPGWGHQISQTTSAGFKYEINDKQETLWVKQSLGSNWQLRLERTPDEDLNELGIRYKIHEFLSAEYVFADKEKWLRLVGNL
ncbi:hypothetical protein SPFL3102_01769 [Sporomusaceae bacterium FL31]|nr:hypothetical protein SPFL3101_03403 [Sporomusaceae bacterium FL31]GCE33960.1 hypothetical protein SPFL3102_01769 [Sporomusaceae bacterium]